jgi:acyl-CoA thioester hydrolase
MTTDDLPLGGHIVDGRHLLPVRVYWEDTDAGGIVYHASYLRFMERGRSEFLRALGLVQSALAAGDAPVLFVVRHMAIDFLKPARLDDLLVVETAPATVGGARLDLTQTVRRDGEAIAAARVTAVSIGPDGRPRRLPAAARAALAPDATRGGDAAGAADGSIAATAES